MRFHFRFGDLRNSYRQHAAYKSNAAAFACKNVTLVLTYDVRTKQNERADSIEGFVISFCGHSSVEAILGYTCRKYKTLKIVNNPDLVNIFGATKKLTKSGFHCRYLLHDLCFV